MLIDREAALVIKTITNTAIEISEKEEKIDMCKAIDDMLSEREAKGEITLTEDMKRYQNIAVNIVEFIDTVADAIGEQLIENRFIQLMSIYRSKKSKGELYKHAICKAQIIVSYVKGSTYFT